MRREAAAVVQALRNHGYTMRGVLALLGDDAYAALGRGEAVPARIALAGQPTQPLADLVRLFLLGETIAAAAAERALPLAPASALGLLVEAGGGASVAAAVHIQPYPTAQGDGYVVSDFPSGRRAGARVLPADHVTGVGGASVTLATITPRRPVDSTLDLGTGCGIQAMLASPHSGSVVATDVSNRALRMAGLTAALSERPFDVRQGSLFEPVAGEQFDLVVANPPFVIAPQAQHTYRETTLNADELGRQVVRGAAEHLNPGGVAVVLANWLHVPGQPWQERVEQWAPPGCQVWVAQREYLTVSEYVELWLKDSAETGSARYEERYAGWYGYLHGFGAAGVGFGWVVLRRSQPHWFVADDLSDSDRLPDGDEVIAQLDRFTALQGLGALRLLAASPRWEADTELQSGQYPATGQDGAIYAYGPWRGPQEVDPLVAQLLQATGPLQQRLAALAGVDEDEALARALIGIRRLLGAGLVGMDG